VKGENVVRKAEIVLREREKGGKRVFCKKFGPGLFKKNP
jgi:hypothetical protein